MDGAVHHSTLPYTAHAVLYSRAHFPDANPDPTRWGRPWFFEGMMSVPLGEKFALIPSLCTQCEMPKEMKEVPLLRDLSYAQGEKAMVDIALGLRWLVPPVPMASFSA